MSQRYAKVSGQRNGARGAALNAGVTSESLNQHRGHPAWCRLWTNLQTRSLTFGPMKSTRNGSYGLKKSQRCFSWGEHTAGVAEQDK